MSVRDGSLIRRAELREILKRQHVSNMSPPGTDAGQNTDKRLTQALELLLEEVHDLEWRIRELEDV